MHSVIPDNNCEVIKLLILKGADVNAKDKKGFTALSRSLLWGNSTTTSLLRTQGTQINTVHEAAGLGEMVALKEYIKNDPQSIE